MSIVTAPLAENPHPKIPTTKPNTITTVRTLHRSIWDSFRENSKLPPNHQPQNQHVD